MQTITLKNSAVDHVQMHLDKTKDGAPLLTIITRNWPGQDIERGMVTQLDAEAIVRLKRWLDEVEA